MELHVSLCGPAKQQLLLHIAAAKIASKLDESQAGRQLEALRQPARRTALWMSFCQTQSQGRFVFDNSIKASFSPRRISFFNVCCFVFFCVCFLKLYLRHLPALKQTADEQRAGKVQRVAKAEPKWSPGKCKGDLKSEARKRAERR